LRGGVDDAVAAQRGAEDFLSRDHGIARELLE